MTFPYVAVSPQSSLPLLTHLAGLLVPRMVLPSAPMMHVIGPCHSLSCPLPSPSDSFLSVHACPTDAYVCVETLLSVCEGGSG